MNERPRLRTAVLVSGSGTNLQAIIDAQNAAAIHTEIVGVLSDRPDAYGLVRASEAGIQTAAINFKGFQERTDYDQELRRAIDSLRPDLIVLAGYMRILPDSTVNAYKGRMLNVHPSLLPAYPGLDTYNRAIAAGESHHGTTVHYVIPELDAGPPVLQYRVAIRANEDEQQLRDRVQAGEYQIYPQAIGWIAEGRLAYSDGGPVLDDKPLTTPVVIDETAD